MSIKYCDFVLGNDLTGNGSNLLPYKTIDKASESLTGGDEIRVSKSPDNVALTGTVSFTKESASVVGDGTLFTSELSVGDFIVGTDGFWYEVASISDDENLTIVGEIGYLTESLASDTIYKIGITDTGSLGQLVSASGISTSNRLKISGGWNLGTEVQTGKTVFICTSGETTGLDLDGNSYVEIDKLSFLQYSINFEGSTGANRLIKNGVFNTSVADAALYLNNDICESIQATGLNYGMLVRVIAGQVSISNNSIFGACGFEVTSNSNYKLTVNNSKFYYTNFEGSSDTYGRYTFDNCEFNNIYIDIGGAGDNIGSREIIIQNSEFNFGMIDGIRCDVLVLSNLVINNFSSTIDIVSSNTKIDNVSISDAGINFQEKVGIVDIKNLQISNCTDAITVNGLADITINKFITTTVTNDFVANGLTYNAMLEVPIIKISHYQTSGINKCYFVNGTSESNTSEARSGKCLKMVPTSSDYYIAHKFYFKANNGVGNTLGLYVKKDASFNGDVKADAYFVGEKIVDNQTITPSTNNTYELKQITINSGDITEDGMVELIIKVRGTSGNIYLDDFSRS